MGDRGWAAAAYVPVPGWQWITARAARQSRLARFHAGQAAVVVVALWLGMLLGGLLQGVSDAGAYQRVLASVAALWLLAAVTALVWGVVGAARGRFVRIPGAYGVLHAFAAARNMSS